MVAFFVYLNTFCIKLLIYLIYRFNLSFFLLDYIFHSIMIAFNSLFLRIDLSVCEDIVSVDFRVQRLRWPKVLWKESSLRQMGLTHQL